MRPVFFSIGAILYDVTREQTIMSARLRRLGVPIALCIMWTCIWLYQGPPWSTLNQGRQPRPISVRLSPPRQGRSTGRNHDDRTMVLLVTYHRGGSSFLGELFQNNPEAWYWFEPLHALSPGLQQAYHSLGETREVAGDFAYFINPDGSLTEVSDTYTKDRLENIRGALECDVTKMAAVRDPFFYRPHGRTNAQSYHSCIKRQTDQDDKFTKCLPGLRHQCSRAKIVVAKTIRFPVYLLRELFEMAPDVKVIFQMRDPRGVIASRKWRIQDDDVVRRGRLLCLEMEKNHRHFTELKMEYGGRLLGIRYEDLASDPSEAAAILYEFLGLPLPPEVEGWIGENTDSDVSNGMRGTRRNSSQVMSKWRTKLNAKEIRDISSACASVLRSYGYDTQ